MFARSKRSYTRNMVLVFFRSWELIVEGVTVPEAESRVYSLRAAQEEAGLLSCNFQSRLTRVLEAREKIRCRYLRRAMECRFSTRIGVRRMPSLLCFIMAGRWPVMT